MSKPKTTPNTDDVQAFLEAVEDEQKRQDSFALLELMQDITDEPPKMWGKSIVGFGSYHYRYASGREGEWMLTAFSPRKASLSIYIMDGLDNHQDLLQKLGKHKTGKACLYVKKLADVDMDILQELITASVQHMRQKYPA